MILRQQVAQGSVHVPGKPLVFQDCLASSTNPAATFLTRNLNGASGDVFEDPRFLNFSRGSLQPEPSSARSSAAAGFLPFLEHRQTFCVKMSQQA